MKLEQSFEVDAPLETVWAALIDVQQVAPCLPGAELTEVGDDGTYHGTFAVKIGPAKASYRGQMVMEEVDEAGHTVTMRASGTDKRGQGGAKATMRSTLTTRDGGGTHVAVETDMTITGRLASFSRGGMIQDVSNRLLGEFAACLQAKLATEDPAPGDAGGPAAPDAGTIGSAGAAEVPGVEAGGGAEALAAQAGVASAMGGGVEAGASGGPAAAAEAAAHQPATPPPPRPRPAAAAPQAGKPISGVALLLGVLRDRLARLFGRGRAR